MNAAKVVSEINGSLFGTWVKVATTLGVGTAFGMAAIAIMYWGFIDPNNVRQAKVEERQQTLVSALTTLVVDQQATNEKLANAIHSLEDRMARLNTSMDNAYELMKNVPAQREQMLKNDAKQIELLERIAKGE